MFRSIFILFTAQLMLVQPALSNDECLIAQPEVGNGEILSCHSSKAFVDFGTAYKVNEKSKKKTDVPDKPTPQFSIVVNRDGGTLKAQAYTPKPNCNPTPSTVHDVQIVGEKSFGVCILTLTEIGNPKRLEIKMFMDDGTSDELVHYLGEDVSNKEMRHLSCHTDFPDDLAEFCK